MIHMQGNVIFITGGNSGMGLATAKVFAEQGVNVAIFGLNKSLNNNAQTIITKDYNVDCLVLTGDVSNESEMSAALEKTYGHFGQLNYAFNNAGVGQLPTALTEQSEEEFDLIFNVNVKGVWLAMKHEIPYMLKSGGGAIVNNASVLGHVGWSQASLYSATKHAIIGLTKSAALEYAPSDLRINALCPGGVKTKVLNRCIGGNPAVEEEVNAIHPIGRLGKPQEMAEGVLWMCSDKASFMTGQSLVIDGGWTAG
jgi:NAD(P)-dependent dehydrogenase (short-subunit alcohol dehydrogenase family)